MRGLTLDDVKTVVFRDDLPEPVLETGTDVIVRVTRAGLCGSDLHPYLGRETVRFGVIPGHEAVGTVTAVGTAVERFQEGERVIVPFTTSCGRCDACLRGLSARCEQGELFGYGSPDGTSTLQGCQAEYVRVPMADGTLVRVPDGLSDETALLLSDNFPTGWHAARRAYARPGRPLAVVGLGAVGLTAVFSALAMGAGPILAIDPVEDRRERAHQLGARTAHPAEADDLAVVMTESGFPSVVDATGALPGQGLAFRLLQTGGTLSVIAVPTFDRFAFSPVNAYDKNVTVVTGRAPVRSILERILPHIDRLAIPADVIVSHPSVPIEDGPDAYRRFAAREQGIVKVAFTFDAP
jgi:alcohol dehydrogenase